MAIRHMPTAKFSKRSFTHNFGIPKKIDHCNLPFTPLKVGAGSMISVVRYRDYLPRKR